MGKNVHVVKRGDNWSVVTVGSQKAVEITNTQKEAIDRKSISQNQKSELVIHGFNGMIREKNSYGTDNHPPKG